MFNAVQSDLHRWNIKESIIPGYFVCKCFMRNKKQSSSCKYDHVTFSHTQWIHTSTLTCPRLSWEPKDVITSWIWSPWKRGGCVDAAWPSDVSVGLIMCWLDLLCLQHKHRPSQLTRYIETPQTNKHICDILKYIMCVCNIRSMRTRVVNKQVEETLHHTADTAEAFCVNINHVFIRLYCLWCWKRMKYSFDFWG